MTAVAKRVDDEQPADQDAALKAVLDAAAKPAQAAFEDMDDDPDFGTVAADKPPPAWAIVPEGVVLPNGWQIWFIQFRAKVTNTPSKGDRYCICWNLSESDEKHAAKRSKGDPMRVIDEMAKQMIRVVDGRPADWGGSRGPGSVDAWWQEIGGKGRHQLKMLYLKNHTMTTEESSDFFEHCVAVRTAG
jgi:hypothetical protein